MYTYYKSEYTHPISSLKEEVSLHCIYLLNHPPHNKTAAFHPPQYLSMIFISHPPPPPTHTPHTHFATSVDLRKASCTDYTVFTRVTNRNILTPPVASKKNCHFHPIPTVLFKSLCHFCGFTASCNEYTMCTWLCYKSEYTHPPVASKKRFHFHPIPTVLYFIHQYILDVS